MANNGCNFRCRPLYPPIDILWNWEIYVCGTINKQPAILYLADSSDDRPIAVCILAIVDQNNGKRFSG